MNKYRENQEMTKHWVSRGRHMTGKLARQFAGGSRRVRIALIAGIYIMTIVIFSMFGFERAGAAITVRPVADGVTTGSVGGTGGTSVTVNKPSGAVRGDVMVATVSFLSAGTISISGWTQVNQTLHSGGTMTLATFYKVATSSEPASYTFSSTLAGQAAAGIITFHGVDMSNVIDNGGTAKSTNQGTGTTLTASGVTTTTSGAVIIASFAHASSSGISQPTGMIEQFEAFGDGTLADVKSSGNTEERPTTGATANRSASTTVSAAWVAHMVALKPAPALALDQASFRFISNLDNIDPRSIVSDYTAGDDTVTASEIDTENGFLYAVGHTGGTSWVVEKRRVVDGSLVTDFDTDGKVVQDITGSSDEKLNDIAIDPGSDAMFLAGHDSAAGAGRWRIEKRSLTTGALETGFGSSGVITYDIDSSRLDTINSIVVDPLTGYLIAGGYEGLNGNGWHIQKRSMTTGALDTNFDGDGIFVYNPANEQQVGSLSIDFGGGYFYVAGFEDRNGNTEWRIDKMRISNGVRCGTANPCGGSVFGSDGSYSFNPSSGTDKVTSMQVDIAGNAIYFGGLSASNSDQWHLHKVDATAGTRINAFDVDGIWEWDSGVNNSSDYITELELDGAGGYLYVIGRDGTNAGTSGGRWRLEKLRRDSGARETAFGTNGTLTSDPSNREDPPTEVIIDVKRGLLYAVGGDRTLGNSNMRWRYEQYQLDTGSKWIGSEDVITYASTNTSFRLRMLLHVTAHNLLLPDNRQFKLQYAPKVGTCDTGFVGEEGFFVDISPAAGDIRYHDNPSVTDATSLTAISGDDPTHGAHTTINQTYEESNNFTAASEVLNGQDGMWEFALKDFGAFGAYCFRAVNSDGTTFDQSGGSYTVVPEISFCKDDPRTENIMRHGTFFCEGTKRAFFWSQ